MSGSQVHFELFVRRKPNAPWILDQASEDRARVLETAETILANGSVAAVKVHKETLDPYTREFNSLVIMSKGAVHAKRETKAREVEDAPLCVTPQDLYSVHARQRIGRLLEGWLRRKTVTPFELLHRPDLAEQLDSSGTEIQHALQKIAVPEAQARGQSTHQMIRTFRGLVDRAIARLVKDGRKAVFPKITPAEFAKAAEALCEDMERSYILGGGVADYMSDGGNWSQKVGLLLDLAEAAPPAGRPRGLAFFVLEQPLSEIMAVKGGLAELLGPDLDLGASLAALTRMAADNEVKAIIRFDPGLKRHLPSLEGEAARLADWLQRDAFEGVRASLARRVLDELNGPRRLRPSDPTGEIEILRALAMALTASAGRLLSLEDVQAAFVERSKALVGGDFVGAYLAGRPSAMAEVEALIKLAENVAGPMNKMAAARWITAGVGALRFETEIRKGPGSPTARLAALADLQRAIRRADLPEAEMLACFEKIGEVGALVEQDCKLISLIARAEAPIPPRLTLLLRLAVGEAGPTGPVAERARVEALRLLRAPDFRTQLAAQPDAVETVKSLMIEAGLAA